MNRLSISILMILAAAPALAVVTAFTDEIAFQDALGQGAYLTVYESFEDDAAWGHVRTPNTAPSVWSNYVTWSTQCTICGVTTGSGPARIGQWGFYQLPHGDPVNGVNDGWIMTGDDVMYGVGGWLETNTFGARVNFIIDGTIVVDFEDHPLDYAHQFYGVIVDEGFLTCEIVETETVDEWYFVFGDDFTFAIDREVGAGESPPVAVTRLVPNVPNPFNPRTVVGFELAAPTVVDLWVGDLAGRRVRTLVTGEFRVAGRHDVVWDGRDDAGRTVPAGVYRCELTAGGARSTRSVTLVK